MTKEEILAIVEKIIGDIDFHGETIQDEESAKNIKVYAYVAVRMVSKLGEVYKQTEGKWEDSSKPLYKEAKGALKVIRDNAPCMENLAGWLSSEDWDTYCSYANDSGLASINVSESAEIVVTDTKGKKYTFPYYEKVDVYNPKKEEEE